MLNNGQTTTKRRQASHSELEWGCFALSHQCIPEGAMQHTAIDTFRTRVERFKAEVRLELPRRSSWKQRLLPIAVLVGWTLVAAACASWFRSGISQSLLDAGSLQRLSAFALWLIAEGVLASLALWVFTGHEEVILNEGYLRLRFSMGRLTWTRDYETGLVGRLRVQRPPITAKDLEEEAETRPPPTGFSLMFDYGDRVVVFAKGVSKEEAEYVRKMLGEREPSVLV